MSPLLVPSTALLSRVRIVVKCHCEQRDVLGFAINCHCLLWGPAQYPAPHSTAHVGDQQLEMALSGVGSGIKVYFRSPRDKMLLPTMRSKVMIQIIVSLERSVRGWSSHEQWVLDTASHVSPILMRS